MRLALGIEYDGTKFSGWQSQGARDIPSVQLAVERAISAIASHPVKIHGAGRTDAGVHACGQVAHCDVDIVRDEYSWVFGCNNKLPDGIRMLWAKEVPGSFDARRSAESRHYKYVIYNHKIRPSLLNNFVGWYYTALDVDRMISAAKAWVGEHDFSSFRGAGCQSVSPVRNIKEINIERRGEMIIVDIIADAFLYHMVRNMVGALIEIGYGRRSVAWAQDVLYARCRTKAGISAKAEGLYLVNVSYPLKFGIPNTNKGLWFINQG